MPCVWAMEAARTPWVWTCFCLWMCVLASRARRSGCFELRVSDTLRAGSALGNVSAGSGWTYAVDARLTPACVRRFVGVGADGLLRVAGAPDCACRRGGPAPLRVRLRPVAADRLVWVHFDVFVHGRGCATPRRRKSAHRDVSVSVSVRAATPCVYAGVLLRNFYELLARFVPNARPDCGVGGGAFPSVYDGSLADKCIRPDHLRRGLDVVCEARAQRVTARLQLLPATRRGHRGVGVVDAWAPRSKRAANTAPQFQLPNYQVSVPENEPAGTRVMTLKALDGDDGDAGRVDYDMEALFDSRSNDYFQINLETGSITTLQPLDREVKDTHVFKVIATDNGKPKRSATAYLTITISDTNDHTPLFELTEYRVSIRENVEVGFEVLTIRATDGDAPSNANMVYKIVSEGGDNMGFEIDPKNGLVKIRVRPDRETLSQYQLIVEANDQGKDPGPRSATATVYISVEDENDNYPQFSEKRYVVQVPENVAASSRVAQVKATDMDAGNNAKVHYSIISGNVKGQFYIHSPTGVIDIINPLDYEMIREYNLRIKAQDGGRPPLINGTGLVVVQVMDVNDNAPMFVSTPFQATVLENVAVGYSVIHIQAIDADSGDNSHLEYRLTDTAPGFPFSINNNTGWVTVCRELDRETTEFYTFGVEAVDQGVPAMSSSAGVTVTVLDVNDNVPAFTQKLYNLKINEDAAVGASVLTLTAIDRDANSVVTYQISSGNTRNRFSITSQSAGGLITLALPLDYKQERQYVLTVAASDGTRQDAAQVHINVTDANTHRPVFQSANYQVMFSEDRPVGSTVVVISATDEDTGENARISYVMEDNVPQFKINPDTGAITTQIEIDYEDQASYTLAIIASDNGIPQKSDTTYVEIIVLDANDNAPQFARDIYQGTVFEDAPVYTSVLQIYATDRDSAANGRVSYTFQGGDDGDGDFFIEPYSGIIRTAKKLDRENMPMYNLKALAVDKGVPPLKAVVDIQVSVLDINDNAPVFEKDEMFVYVVENSAVGSIVARISATDPDEGTNAQILFQIVEGNSPEVFQLDMFNGDLIALTDLDYESKIEYTIIVQATSAPLVSRAVVHIHLLDVNDNHPVLPDFEIIFNNYITNRSSSFPAGVIGKVPAQDPDVSDKLHYSFVEGNDLSLLILNQDTGELQLSRDLDNNRPLEATMKIKVTDGVHAVTALCTLRVAIITDDMLSNSITVRLGDMSKERFLSPLLSRFLEGVAAVLSARRDGVFVFNVQNDTHVRGSVLNVTFSALRPPWAPGSEPPGTFLPAEALQERIYLNRTLLAQVSAQHVLPFDDNICLREPCENYMKCVSVLRFDGSAPFVASDTVLFRPIRPVSGLRCRCPTGFTGDYCETEVDLCYSSPCGNRGRCRSREGGYTCQCLEDFTGERCEVNARSGRCVPGVCKNGGRCVDLLVGGFMCQCPPGEFQKPYCEVTTRSFPGQSFVTFRGLRQRFHFTLSFRFATRERNVLLLYNGRFNEKHDFIALELIDEQVQLTFSAGETKTTVSPFVQGGLSDGQWHSVLLRYYNKPNIGRLGVPHGPSGEKVAVVSVDDCDVSMAVRFGSHMGNYTCAAQGTQTGQKKSLDLTGPLLLGGVPNLPEDFPIRNRDFVGCIKDLSIDSEPVDMAGFIANNGTAAGCAVKKDFCTSVVCQNGGVCVNQWNTHMCDCPLGYGGKNCEQVMPSPLHFDGHALLWWREPEVTISVPWYLGLMFRTRQASGTLLQANAGDFSRIHLVLSGHSLRFQVFLGVKRVALLDFPRVRVSDGRWHHVLVELKSVKDGKDIKYLALVSLDYGMFQRSVEIGNELPGLRLRSLFVGGLVKKDGTVLNGLKGCVQGVRMGETSTKLANVHAHQGQKVRVTEGCQVEDSCGPPSVCPLNSRCHDDWGSHRCVCNPGFFGKDCVDACLLNPCQHASSCVRQPGSAAGYRCQCGDGFYGKYCQTKSSLPCARGWWGDPVCGPCNCDVNKGFHRNCNKTTGECRCKDNYFRPPGVDSCHPCDCFQVGALSRTCDPASGQCQCRTGVIGRQCNRCDNPYAEVTSSGCTVVYEGCPKAFDAGIWWPKTQFGQPAAMKCPKGSTGTVIRHCSDEHAWLPPDLFNCTSLTFTQLMKEDEELHLNGSRMNGEASLHLARMLRVATEQTPDLHGNDVKTAYSLLTRLLHYESQQQGFDMAATRDVTFHQNIVQAVAAILDHGSGMHWKLIQRTEAGTALLLRRLEEYAQNLARNLWKTYLTPFTVVSPNMIFAVDYVEAAGSEEERASQFPKVQSVLPADLQSYAVFPESLFQTEDIQSTPVPMETPIDGPAVTTVGVPAVVQTASTPISESPPGSTKKKRHAEVRGPLPVAVVMVFPTLGDLLPENYDHDRRSLRLPNRPVINTPVVSTVFYREALPANAPWDEPVTLQYRLLETQERTKPVCVFWNHSVAVKGSGGWSSRGCELLSRNSTHISCQCSHTSSFAVLMDVSKREHGEVLPLKIVTYTTISASLVTLLITYLLLAILRRLRSNLHSIHRNLVASTFLSELVFLFGINQSDNTFVCTVVAILLHYSYMCTFAWMLVEGLHIYRMLTELRNVNHGHMRFYYAMGWGIPAVITGLAVGLDPQGFGNPDFCWLSVHDSLIWSIAGPIAIVVMANIAIFLLAAKASCSQRHWTFEKSGAISALRLAFLLLLLLSATWLLGLMAVNSDALSFHYLFAIFSCLQGACIFLFHCIFNDEVRSNLKDVFVGKRTIKEELLFTRAAMLTRSLNGKHSFTDDDGLYRTTIGESTASLENTVRSTRSDCSSSQARNDSILKRTSSSTARNGHRGDGDPSAFIRKRSKRQESDSDSDMSENSSSYASSHSDDSDDDRRRHRQKHRWNNERTPLAHAGPDLVGPYWPAEPPTASEGEGPGGGETLRVETKVSVELHQDSKPGAGTASETDGAEKDKAPPSSPDSNHPRERRRGILKNKITYPPPVADKNMKNRLREKLSDYTSPTIPPRSPVIPSSPTSRGLRHVTGGNGVLIKLPPPRPPSSPRQQHNGVAMVTTMLATPVVNGTKEHHSSDSDGSNETSI